MALSLYMGDTWEQGLKDFQGFIQDTAAATKEFMDSTKRQREESEMAFNVTVQNALKPAAQSLIDNMAPKSDVTIRVIWDHEFKNSDGSPMMDSKNNPVRGLFVAVDPFNWEGKKTRAASTSTATGSSGRIPGDYIFGDEVFANMSDFSKKYLAEEFNAKGTQTTRAFLESKGYTIPSEPITGEDGKPHFIVEMPKVA